MRYPNGRWSLKDFGVSGLDSTSAALSRAASPLTPSPIQNFGVSGGVEGTDTRLGQNSPLDPDCLQRVALKEGETRIAGVVTGPLTPIDFLSPLKDRHVAMQSLDRFPLRDTDLDPDDHESREQIEMEAAEAKADQERSE